MDIKDKYDWDKYFLPMNAKESGKKADALLDNPNYIAEHKFDGSRYWSIDGRLFSRRLSVKDGKPLEKTDNVPHISNELHKLPPGTLLDGEIYYPNSNSMQVTSIMGAKPEKAVERQALNPIRYAVFDMPMYNGQDLTHLPWYKRRELLENVYNTHLSSSKHVDLTEVVRGDKRKFLDEMLSTGQEGIMLKNIHAEYRPDKRPEHHWYKVKKNLTDDVIVMGYTDGQGKYAGLIGSIIFGKYDKKGGKLVQLGRCSGFTDAQRTEITKHPQKYLGKVIEISAMEGTEAGFYRHPQFKQLRVDKGPEQCLIHE